MLRKTRFVCLSDTHGYKPSEAGFKLPAGDVMIHAGDLTNQGSESELRKTMNWIAAADFEVKIIICGNHDITLDEPFYSQYGSKFHNKVPQDPAKCIDIVTTASPSIAFLKHESALIRLRNPTGPNTAFKVFGSPYSQCDGTWAFLYESHEAEELWRQIPFDADIVVTHMPPHLHCDQIAGVSMGCKTLRKNLERVRPMLTVCGHIHESRGYERVSWGDTEGDEAEDRVTRGTLPPQGSKKQSLVDLTGKRAPRLKNDGFSVSIYRDEEQSSACRNAGFVSPQSHQAEQAPGFLHPILSLTETQTNDARKLRDYRHETCIVNAAILANNWPNRGGRKFYPGPIVVDLELPVWTEKVT
ncbi:Metallo-dependent phosphatase-like protein [Aspergillus crustosus]